jgi:hypothetical protein
MASSRIFLVCLLALVLVADQQTVKVEAARDLQQTIVGCKTHGGFHKNRKTCTACHDDYKLLPGGWECVKVNTVKVHGH